MLLLLWMLLGFPDLDAEKYFVSFQMLKSFGQFFIVEIFFGQFLIVEKLVFYTHSSSGVELVGLSSLRKACGGRMFESKL